MRRRVALQPGERRRRHRRGPAGRTRSTGQLERLNAEHVEAERDRAEHAADDELVDELHREHDDARAGQRQAEAQQRSRDRRGRSRTRTGSARTENSTAPTSGPARRPTARLIAPMPDERAARSTTSAPSQLDRSGRSIIRRPARNSRCSSAAGVATMPLITTLSAEHADDGGGRRVRPSPRRTRGATAIATAADATLESVDRVATVGAISSGEPGQRTIARLTPELVEAEHGEQRQQRRRRTCRTPPGRGSAPARCRSRACRAATPAC